jgi:hypothetical protein
MATLGLPFLDVLAAAAAFLPGGRPRLFSAVVFSGLRLQLPEAFLFIPTAEISALTLGSLV